MINKSVYIAGVARSGTSWLGQIFNSSPVVDFRFQPMFSYELKELLPENPVKDDFINFYEAMKVTKSSFLSQEDKIKSGDYPKFLKDEVKSTLAFKENRYQYFIEPLLRYVPEMKLIGIIRHPCATLNSWRNNEKEFPPNSDFIKEWRFGDCKNEGHHDFFGYYKWKEVANLYLDLQDKWPDRVKVVHYEDLVMNPHAVVTELFGFCDIAFTEQTNVFLEKSTSLHNNSYYSVFKNKSVTTAWKNDFPEEVLRDVEYDLKGTRLERFILEVVR
ncbi:sulfotransferase family protein [Shewanella halifaxensis]|uniref:sulfotransferase family protein n=1 Tax=Shewanella halifaxensis TaxID=271098 RepID=UPI000D5997E2|nr:sulfotransferase [Shewanella halifaxensis]